MKNPTINRCAGWLAAGLVLFDLASLGAYQDLGGKNPSLGFEQPAIAGYLAGLLAQPALQADPLTTICYAVWQHGLAADKLTSERKNWIVEDLAEVIGNAAGQN